MKGSYLVPVIVLLVLASVLGYLVFTNMPNKDVKKTQDAQTVEGTNFKQIDSVAPFVNKLTEAERKILTSTPLATATDEEKSSFSQLVHQEAKAGNLITISEGCQASPVVLSPSGLGLQVKNNDTTVHQLTFSPNEQYSISSGETKSITFGENRRGKTITFSCQTAGRVGFIIFPK